MFVTKTLLIKSLVDPVISTKKSEFVSECLHYNKYFIKNMTRKDCMD